MADMAGSHPTTRNLVDEGLERTIGVCLNWTTRAVIKLTPYAERLAYRAAQGPCQICEGGKDGLPPPPRALGTG
ncbi:hypothetical protein C0991_007151 [Blastosporella zonata]|nr:hypothetical protein C0991_007151 [Blastosporella zonata]